MVSIPSIQVCISNFINISIIKIIRDIVSIPSIQVCISNLAEAIELSKSQSLNPFYSGLYFQLY